MTDDVLDVLHFLADVTRAQNTLKLRQLFLGSHAKVLHRSGLKMRVV